MLHLLELLCIVKCTVVTFLEPSGHFGLKMAVLPVSLLNRARYDLGRLLRVFLREHKQQHPKQQLTRHSNQERHDVLSEATRGAHLVLATIATLCVGDPQPGGAVGVADLVAPSEGDRLAVVIPRGPRQRASSDRHFQADHLVLLEYQAVLILAGYTNTRRRWEREYEVSVTVMLVTCRRMTGHNALQG